MKFRTRYIVRGDRPGLEQAARAILRGGLVAFPTETVYGLGANAFDETAVRNIFLVKGRPSDNPLIVHVSSAAEAESLFQSPPPHFEELTSAFWPGPLSIVGRRHASVPDLVTAGLSTVAVRMPDHPVALALIRRAGVPLVAPSANRSGAPSPTSWEDVREDLGGKIWGVLEGGKCAIGIESTVLDTRGSVPRILRPGRIGAEEIGELLGLHVSLARPSAARPASPGMKYVHYAPKAPLLLFVGSEEALIAAMKRYLDRRARPEYRIGVLAPARMRRLGADAFHSLGNGGAIDYARRLYDGMRALDRQGVDEILAPGIPESGLGLAVMNRLRKAATRILIARK